MLEIGYIALSFLMILIIIFGYRAELRKSITNKRERKRRMEILIGFFIVWFIYLGVLSQQEILFELSFPPRVPIFIFLPLIIVTTYFYFKHRDDAVIRNLPKSYPVYYQTFRIVVETILLYTFYKGILTEYATFEGWNFDVIMGISAPFMAIFVFRNQVKYRFLAKAWNILGILMVLFVAFIVAASFYQPQLLGSETPLTSTEFVKLPYILVPGFLAPSAIFMHIVSLMQLRHK